MSDAEISLLKSRIRELETILNTSSKTIEASFRLSQALSKLLGLLMAMPCVSSDTITGRLKVATDSKVAIWRLRQELKPWDIEVQSKRGVGWWLDDATKERVKKVIAGEITLEVIESAADDVTLEVAEQAA
jgi:hypothetical protein